MSYALRRYAVPPTGTKPSDLPVEWCRRGRQRRAVASRRGRRRSRGGDPPGRIRRAPRSRRSHDWLAGRGVAADVLGDPGTGVTGISLSSQRVRPGDLYAALPGARAHGIDFVGDALQPPGRSRCSPTRRARRRLPRRRPGARRRARRARCSAASPPRVYGEPAAALRMIGVTGTQGKTTTTRLAEGGPAGTPASRPR